MIKRLFDVIFSFLLIAALAPIMILTAILIRVKLGRPVLFKQIRPGLHENFFTLIKFRTMTDEKNKAGDFLSDAERLTVFGKFLRSTSLDELPQLFNVLKGDMSFVGPRPLLVEYLPLYNQEQKRRHEVRPGITGWAQVNGRNNLSWDEKFKHDAWYVDHQTLLLDLKILLLTIKKVFLADGINGKASATMEKFTGTNF